MKALPEQNLLALDLKEMNAFAGAAPNMNKHGGNRNSCASHKLCRTKAYACVPRNNMAAASMLK